MYRARERQGVGTAVEGIGCYQAGRKIAEEPISDEDKGSENEDVSSFLPSLGLPHCTLELSWCNRRGDGNTRLLSSHSREHAGSRKGPRPHHRAGQGHSPGTAPGQHWLQPSSLPF